jgi:SAM-dependent methyltransferase
MTALENQLAEGILDVVASADLGKVVDLGCGSAKLLCRVCGDHAGAHGLGLDVDAAACEAARRTIEREGLAERVDVMQADVGRLGEVPEAALADADVVIAMFVMHELLEQRGRDGVVESLGHIRDAVGGDGRLVLIEVSATDGAQAQEDLLFVPEYELVHDFSKQRLATREEWGHILGDAGLDLVQVEPAGLCRALCMVAQAA